MITVWIYDLTKFEVKEEQVNFISEKPHAAVRTRKPGGHSENTKKWSRFEFTETAAWGKVYEFLTEEINIRETRLAPLKAKHKEIHDTKLVSNE